MKPPPRTRVKPVQRLIEEHRHRNKNEKKKKWRLSEQKELITALKALKNRHKSTPEDIDYEFIAERLPSRSQLEIQSCIDSLKNRVITCATANLKRQKTEKEKAKKPVEEWTSLASLVAGTQEESISTAFSQMLAVSATEPLTLKNSVPPQNTNQNAATAGVNSNGKTDASKTCTDEKAVNFEKIYQYLSVIDKPDEDSHLTPMESAVVLNLLMSLPEQLSLLDCTALHKHLMQVYTCFSSSADSGTITELFEGLRGGVDTQRDKKSSGSSVTTDGDDNNVRTADSSGVTGSERQHVAEGQSAGTDATSGSEKADVPELCPPLNPFVVPLTLLTCTKLTSAATANPD